MNSSILSMHVSSNKTIQLVRHILYIVKMVWSVQKNLFKKSFKVCNRLRFMFNFLCMCIWFYFHTIQCICWDLQCVYLNYFLCYYQFVNKTALNEKKSTHYANHGFVQNLDSEQSNRLIGKILIFISIQTESPNNCSSRNIHKYDRTYDIWNTLYH